VSSVPINRHSRLNFEIVSPLYTSYPSFLADTNKKITLMEIPVTLVLSIDAQAWPNEIYVGYG
jgi:hypothetical protein